MIAIEFVQLKHSHKQVHFYLHCQENTTLLNALHLINQNNLSEFNSTYELIVSGKIRIGIFSQIIPFPIPSDYKLNDGDRIEMYRNLLLDPKKARLHRLKKSLK